VLPSPTRDQELKGNKESSPPAGDQELLGNKELTPPSPPAQVPEFQVPFTVAIIVAGTCYTIPKENTQSKSLIMVLM
jgi:hypothetical protein